MAQVMQWSDQFETGITDIDFQHRKLVSMINNLGEAMTDKDPIGRQMVIKITLEQLIEYTVYHFANEEKYFEKTHYSDRVSHIQSHEALKIQVTDLYAKVESGQSVSTEDVMVFLKNWLTNHILKEDMAYVSTIKAHLDKSV